MKRRMLFGGWFVLAVLALSWVFAAWRSLRVGWDAWAAMRGVGAGLLLLVSLGVLGFFLYMTDRRRGKIRRPIGLYEWWLGRVSGGDG